MDYRKSENQKYYFFIVFSLAVVLAFTIKSYISQRRENQALRLQVMITNKEKRKPKPWGRLTASQPVQSLSPQASPAAAASELKTDIVSIGASATTRMNGRINTTEAIAVELQDKMANIKNLDLAQLGRTIELSNELILREPETYSAYKAKLIALLTREGKYNISVDDDAINSLLEDMARFDLTSDKVLQKEAALISNANAEVRNLEQKVTETQGQLNALETQMAQLDPNTPYYRILDARRAVLSMQLEDSSGKIALIEDQIQRGDFPPDTLINEDIVQIPFMRSMARGDYDEAADNAETFVQQFPASPVGYFYLVLALEKSGRKEEAIEVLARSRLGGNEQAQLLDRIANARMENPQKYWERLKF